MLAPPRGLLHPMLLRIPESVRFLTSGGIGSVLFFWCDAVLRKRNPFSWQKTTVSYILAYLLSIIWQKVLHERLVFGVKPNEAFLRGLMLLYATYAVSIALSALVNGLLVNWIGVVEPYTSILTLAVVSVYNYFAVSATMK